MLRTMPETPLEAEALEKELERLPEVSAARVVTGPSGRILEIHLVTDGTKAPKQLTRDVETVAATRGLDIDRRTISIAQMPEATRKGARGIELASINIGVENAQATCRVRVKLGEHEAIGEATAPATPSARARVVARATLGAVSSLLSDPSSAECDDVRLVEMAGREIVIAALSIASSTGHANALGLSVVDADRDEAIAAAVIDAVARHQEA